MQLLDWIENLTFGANPFATLFLCIGVVACGLGVWAHGFYERTAGESIKSGNNNNNNTISSKNTTAGTTKNEDDKHKRFLAFRKKFLIVYLLATLADWLQGPYFYSAIAKKNLAAEEIGSLFVTGYVSSMFFSPVAGPLVDMYGRKQAMLVFNCIYFLTCCSMFSSSFTVLFLGRVASGCSASLLNSAYEAWMVHEHEKATYSKLLLTHTFQFMSLTKYIVAVLAGILASASVHLFSHSSSSDGGEYGPQPQPLYEAPFALSAVVLIVGFFVTHHTLEENYGERGRSSVMSLEVVSVSLQKALHLMRSDARVLLLAIVQTCFEGSVFVFVFIWTPALAQSNNIAIESSNTDGSSTSTSGSSNSDISSSTAQSRDVPHGLVFGMFMMCCMIGSFVFRLLVAATPTLATSSSPKANTSRTVFESTTSAVYVVALLSIVVAVWIPGDVGVRLLAFCFFEATIGVYYPTVGTIRSRLIPNEIRGTVLNLFRVGLNVVVVVVVVLLSKGTETVSNVLFVIIALLGICVGADNALSRRLRGGG